MEASVNWGVPVGETPATEMPRGAGRRRWLTTPAWVLAGLLPLIGLISLLLHSRIDPGWTNHKVHFVLFLTVGSVSAVLAVAAGQAGARRGACPGVLPVA